MLAGPDGPTLTMLDADWEEIAKCKTTFVTSVGPERASGLWLRRLPSQHRRKLASARSDVRKTIMEMRCHLTVELRRRQSCDLGSADLAEYGRVAPSFV